MTNLPEKYHGRKFGDYWLNLITGQRYMWMGLRWIGTGEYPYGTNPMGF